MILEAQDTACVSRRLAIATDTLQTLKVKKELLQRAYSSSEAQYEVESNKKADTEKARDVMIDVSSIAQRLTVGAIEQLVTKALQGVFGVNYSFEIESKMCRNKNEANFWVVIDGHRHSLDGQLGGGVVDMVSFALRVVVWSIQSPDGNRVFILDEPAKFISKDKLPLFGGFLKELNELLGIQFIIITHEQELSSLGTSVVNVTKKDGVSYVG